MYKVYVLFNEKNNKIYIGQTKDLADRIWLHSDKIFQNSYTSRYDGKWEIAYEEPYKTREEAIKRERQLKSYQGRQFIKNNIPRWRNGSARDCEISQLSKEILE